MIKGGPGTGKTIISRAIPYYVGHESLDIDDVYTKDIQADRNEIELYNESEFVEYIQIHPSMTYEDIVYGIEFSSSGSLAMAYAEKRIKRLCDRAMGRPEKFFIILDDIGRTNAGYLLGNLLYAMEYRNQAVGLADGSTMIVPDNVYLIITECRTLYGNPMEYALRRRFDYEKELHSDAAVLDRYYGNCLMPAVKNIVLNVFRTVCNFVYAYILKDPTIQTENYIPGHGMLMVDRQGNPQHILLKIEQKFKYQLAPYLVDMEMAGILTCNRNDLDNLLLDIENQLNVGQNAAINTTVVQKIFYGGRVPVPAFGVIDAHNYYANNIVPQYCKEHRTIIESIIDAVFTNGVFNVEKALSDILLNTDIVRFEHRTIPGIYAAFLVESPQNNNFGYLTTVSNNIRSYYSSNSCRTGRWVGYSDAPAYKVTYANGVERTYIPLNAFRNTGFDTSTRVIHAEENTASIYCALYRLVWAYLSAYETNLSLLAAQDASYTDLYKLVSFEKIYWEEKNREARNIRGADAKLQELGTAVLNLRTLWNQAGTMVIVDEIRFNELVDGILPVSVINYENLYTAVGLGKSIEIRGVDTMVDFSDYQQVMESIGVRQMIFQGPPGTSKTFESKKFVLKHLKPGSSVFSSNNATQEEISNELEPFKLSASDYDDPSGSSKLTTGGWDLVQFHPSYGYEDFIRGIEVKPVNGTPTYASVNRILGKIAEFAKLAEVGAVHGNIPRFYLVIDEINRANLATVFGELIYGLEYRNSKVSTPYEVNDRVLNAVSKDIVLGKNLFIIGTMNTADKSIDSIDYAIRRRFIFVDSPAKRDVVVSCYQNTMSVTDEHSIEVLLFDSVGYLFEGTHFFNDEYQRNDVRIGHTYFLRTSSTEYRKIMIERFVFQVVPILREYLKDGIIDSFEDLKANEHSCTDIKNAADGDRIKLVAENIMLYVKHFGENNATGVPIDNNYIAEFTEKLCDELGY